MKTPDFAPSSRLATLPGRLDSRRLRRASREATSGRPGAPRTSGLSDKAAGVLDDSAKSENDKDFLLQSVG
jgi:hypothetical protein